MVLKYGFDPPEPSAATQHQDGECGEPGPERQLSVGGGGAQYAV